MNSSRPVYALVCSDNGVDGRAIIMESHVDTTKLELERRARSLRGQYGECLIVELPLQINTSIQRLAGSTDKVESIDNL